MNSQNLARVFRPRSVAVIGATARPGSVGRTVLQNMMQAGFPGALYPINLKRPEVLGLRAFRDVADAPERPDLAVICTPAPTTPALVRRCGEAGVGGVVIISAGFRETGSAGKELEEQLAAESKRWPEMRIIGPNCVGILNPKSRLNASFAAAMPLVGHIAFISQSGALCTAILDWSLSANIGFSHFVSIGNALDVDFSDLIDYLANDADTTSIVLYVESIAKAAEFLSAARTFTRTKPIVAYKAGRFAASAQAAASHTGAMAGTDGVYDAAFRRAGVVRVEEAEDMFDCAELLATHRIPRGPRLGIVTNAGGPGVMAADELLKKRGELARLTSATIERLNGELPPHWSHANPVDVLGDAGADRFARAISLVLEDANADAVLAIVAPQAITDPTDMAKKTARLAAATSKPILAAWMGGASVEEGRRLLTAAGIAAYGLPERAVRAFNYMLSYSKGRQSLDEGPWDQAPRLIGVDRQAAGALIAEFTPGPGGVLSESDSKALISAYGIETTFPMLASTQSAAVKLCREIGYPVVMKLQSPDVTHKTEVGGVEMGVADERAVREAYDRIIRSLHARRPEARVDGVTVQSMAYSPTGVELIAGAKRDPAFGPVVLVGAGGILAELLGDQSLELAPLDERLARRMLESLRAWALLSGFRGRPAVNIERVIDTLMRLSCLILDQPAVRELDVNPLLATPARAVALDARIILTAEATPNTRGAAADRVVEASASELR